MSLCTCGSWRRTSFGLVCRQCGKHKRNQKKRTENSSKPESFEAKLKEIQEQYQNLDDGPNHHQVLSYEMVNNEIVVTSIVYDAERAARKQFPKFVKTWKL